MKPSNLLLQRERERERESPGISLVPWVSAEAPVPPDPLGLPETSASDSASEGPGPLSSEGKVQSPPSPESAATKVSREAGQLRRAGRWNAQAPSSTSEAKLLMSSAGNFSAAE
eukprot:2038295-Pyramimonas_sp.AAC.1